MAHLKIIYIYGKSMYRWNHRGKVQYVTPKLGGKTVIIHRH